jgi:alginate O-acetyltransferase complex protein AlgI
MLFNTLEFLVFFLVVLGLYSVLKHPRQNALLLVASYVFYGAWDYRFLLLLIGTTMVDYWVALAVHRQADVIRRRHILLFSIVANLGVLGIFKYFNFFADSLVQLAGGLGLTVSPVTLNIILPVGVSFYTFQSMSYTIDVYRGHVQPCRRLSDFALYVAFFPQLVAGPIERPTTLLPQITSPRTMTVEKIGAGLSLIALGLFKKVVMADNLAPTVDAIFSKQGGFTAGEVLIGALLFAFQIYGDFSGYTDIARGSSRILGFELRQNFRQPYFARDPSDFWRRWHISLSTWLRDYLYVSLGGNRDGKARTYRNLMLTMILGGLWHGAAWNFVLWGFYHGALLVGYRLYDERRASRGSVATTSAGGALMAAVPIGVMFIFTLYGWLLFRATSGSQIVEMTLALGHFESWQFVAQELARLAFYAWPVVLIDYLNYRWRDDEPAITRAPLLVQAAAYSGLFLMFLVLGSYEGASFIYFQF